MFLQRMAEQSLNYDMFRQNYAMITDYLTFF
jgi:hypothetical protein